MKTTLMPISQRRAYRWINKHHRHLSSSKGDLFRVSLVNERNHLLLAVGVAGRPCRALQNGQTAEFLRITSIAPVTVNACSILYGALRRAGFALGYTRFVTYTLPHEPGTSLKAAGFADDGLTDGGEWSRPSRQRRAAEQPSQKRRWIYPDRSSGLWTHKQSR